MDSSGDVLEIVGSLTKGVNVPGEILSMHVNKLQENVGALSGTVQELPHRPLQVT